MMGKTAKEELKSLAKGRYFSMAAKFTDTSFSEEMEYSLYIDGTKIHTGQTWKEAFKSLREELSR